MPIGAPVNKTSKPDVYAVDFAVKPGETRFDLTYTVPYTEGATLPRQNRHQGREHLPDRAQRRHAHRRGPERPRRRAAHPGPHLRPRRNLLQDPVDRRRSRAARGRRRPARVERPADRADHAARLQSGDRLHPGSRAGHPGAGLRPLYRAEPQGVNERGRHERASATAMSAESRWQSRVSGSSTAITLPCATSG